MRFQEVTTLALINLIQFLIQNTPIVSSNYKENLNIFDEQHHSSHQEERLTQGTLFDIFAHTASTDESKLRLALLFDDKIDLNKDSFVQLDELVGWLRKCQDKYAQEDVKRHWITFEKLDPDDDTLSWEEFTRTEHEHISNIRKYSDNSHHSTRIKDAHDSALKKDLRRWKGADFNQDGKLTRDEFKYFLYPELSDRLHYILVSEKLESIDTNKDGLISMDEFVTDSSTEEMHINTKNNTDWLNKERSKFINKLDTNHDSYLDENELGIWMRKSDLYDHTIAEAQQLMQRADLNRDHRLSKEEVLSAYHEFINSHATDFGEALREQSESSHDEL